MYQNILFRAQNGRKYGKTETLSVHALGNISEFYITFFLQELG